MSTLGMVTPIIATIKNIIHKKDKTGKSSTLIQHNPVQYQSSEEEDSIDIAETDDTLDGEIFRRIYREY